MDKDYISGLTLSGGDPLFEGNLGDVLDLVTEVNKRYNTTRYIDENNQNNHNILNANANKIRLSSPQKSIWLYTGFIWEEIRKGNMEDGLKYGNWTKRAKIITECDVMIDGRYIDLQRDISLPWRGSKNQRVIDIKKTLQKGEVVLYSK